MRFVGGTPLTKAPAGKKNGSQGVPKELCPHIAADLRNTSTSRHCMGEVFFCEHALTLPPVCNQFPLFRHGIVEASNITSQRFWLTLQYSDEAAFKKAYKREPGMTPSESKA